MAKVSKSKYVVVLLLVLSMVVTTFVMATDSYATTAAQKKKEAAAAGEKAADFNAKVGEATKKVQELESNINSAQANINATQSKLEAKKAEVSRQTEALNSRLRAMYKTGTAGFINIILSSDNVSELITNVSMVQRVLSNDKKLLGSLQNDYNEIDALKKQQVEQEKVLKDNKKQVEELRDKYKGLADEYAKQQDQLNSEGDKLAAEAMAAQAAAEEKLRQQQASQPQSQPQSKPSGGGSSTPARPSTPAVSSGGYQWPVSGGTITSPFGWRVHPIFHTKKYHDGVDVSGLPTGTPIRSIANGYVTKASYYGGYGNCVMISIGNGYTTLYGHMSRFAVSNGQYVTKGQVVGYIGSTGWSTGPHLHFSLIKNGRYINPMSIF